MSDLEEALEKAGSKLSKAGKTTANDLSKKLGKALQQIKTLLTGKSKLQNDRSEGAADGGGSSCQDCQA